MTFGSIRWKCVVSLVCLSACGGGEVPASAPAPAATAGSEPQPAATPAAEPEEAGDGDVAEQPAEPAAQVAKPVVLPPRYAALITQAVKDYDGWKEAFDDGRSMRQQAGVVRHLVLLHPKAKAKVTVLLMARDLDPLQALLGGEELKKAMAEAGVKGKPVITPMALVQDATSQEISGHASALVKHKVANFEDWKEAFDADAQAREQAGLDGYAVATAIDDDKTVYVYLQAQERETLDAFLGSKDLKQAMQEAGVKGKPEITRLDEEEEENYP